MKRFIPTSLFGRFMLIIITPVVILQALSVYLFYERHWDSVTRRLAMSVAGDIAMLVDLAESGTPLAEINKVSQPRMWMRVQKEAAEEAPDVLLSPENLITKTLMRELHHFFNFPFEIRHQKDQERIVVRVFYPSATYMFLFPEKRMFSSTTYIFLLWVVGMTFVLYSIAILFMRNQIRPIRQLADTADKLGRGEEVSDEDMKPHGATEIRQAALAFKRMRDRIQRQIKAQSAMLTGVSHDLRTPLTRLRLQTAMMKPSDDRDDMLKDVREMEGLINNYLAFMKGEDDELPKKADIRKLVQEIVNKYDPDKQQVSIKKSEKYMVDVRVTSLQRAVTNVLTNAIKYGQKAKISIKRDPHTVNVIVEDNGPGIPEDQMSAVFQPFHRLEESRNSETGGVGLGLPIARQAMKDNGGSIELENMKKGGLRVTLAFPAAE